MKRLHLLILLSLLALLSLPGFAAASPSDPPTPAPTPLPNLELTSLEPGQVINDTGATLSIYGRGFDANCVVQLVGYGLLGTNLVNAQALTANLPPGVPPGTYTLRVSDGTGLTHRSKELPAALVVRAPAAVAPPAAPPPPGRPILTIRNYTVEPTRVRAGQEFVVSIELYNNGSRAGENTMVLFPGGTFLPVGETGHILGQLHINHTVVISQRMRAPETLSSGVHNVTIDLTANDWEGNNYSYSGNVPLEVIGKPTDTGGAPTGKPRIVIEEVQTDPAVLVPGEPFTLTLVLGNRGNRTATSIFITSASTDMAVPASGSDTVSTPKIGVGESVTVTLPLLLGNLRTGGRQNMGIKMDYSDLNGGGYSDAQNIGVDINTSLIRQPQLLIESYTTEPDFLSPGDTFTLTLRVANVGGGDAGRLTLALGGEEGTGLAPFIPLKAGNVLFVSELLKGDSVILSRALIIDGSAEARAYSLPIALAYDDPRASRQEDVQRLSIIVRKRPEIQANFYRAPDMLMVDMPMLVALEVLNVGRSAINVAELTAYAEGINITAEGIPFIGPLDPGGSAPLDLMLIPEASGPTELVISIRYRDEFNQVQMITDTLSIEVMGESEGWPEGPGGPEGPNGPSGPETEPGFQPPETLLQKIGRALRGFFGFGS
jgi:hypothetical protein